RSGHVRSGRRERRSAAAGRGSVRIADDKLGAFQAVTEINLRAAQILHAHRIDQQLHALVLDTGVAVLNLLIEFEPILETGAAAALHEDAQLQLRVALTTDQIADLAGSSIREYQRALGRGLGSDNVIH